MQRPVEEAIIRNETVEVECPTLLQMMVKFKLKLKLRPRRKSCGGIGYTIVDILCDVIPGLEKGSAR